MRAEEFIEDGIVLSVENGYAEVALRQSDACEECTAKIFCKPGAEDSKKLKVVDPYGAKPGDSVKVAVPGAAVLKATIMLYGIPLVILVLGLFLGLEMFATTSVPEFYAFLLSIGMIAVYVGGLLLFSKGKTSENKAKILYIKRDID